MQKSEFMILPQPIARCIDSIGQKFTGPTKIEDTIVISGTPRSGTTWLMEMLATLPDYKTLFEPFHINLFPEVKNLGLAPSPYLNPDSNYPNVNYCLKKNFEGKMISRKPFYRPSNIKSRLTAGKLIVKSVRVNRLLPYIAENFSLRQIYVIIRHPCATISSQIKYGIFGYFGSPILPVKKTIINSCMEIPEIRQNKKLMEEVKNIRDVEELLAFIWGIDTYIPLIYAKDYDFYVLTYEKLMIEQEKELKKIFHKINEEIPEKAYPLLREQSMLALDFIKEKRKQLSKWKKNLSRNQINKILKITEWFNLDFYTDDVEMDYNKLMNWI